MGNPKDKEDSGTMGEGAESAHNVHQAARDLSHERDVALTRQIAEAIAREIAKAHIHYQTLLNERSVAAMPTSLKVTSGAAGFKVMDPLTGPRTRLSTRDGKYGQKRLDMPLKQWQMIQKRLKFHISTTG